jgi:RimJ/RimL family protein N-acetyltransferase
VRDFDPDRVTPPLTVPRLAAPPLLLRPFDPGDVDLVRTASRDPLVTAISSIEPSCDDAAARAFVERQRSLAVDGHAYPFVVARERDPGAGIGSIGLWLQEIDQGRATVGYWLLESARGHSLAAQALAAVTRFVFTDLAIPRLQLFAEPRNAASAGTARHAGFRYEATLRGWARIGGQQRDADCYALLRTEWSDSGD